MFYFLFRIYICIIPAIRCILNLTTEEKINIDIDDLKVSEIVVPKEVILKWQKIVNSIAEFINVPAALIMKLNPPYIEVFRSSETI
ncbi:hypothetical protein LCGC14_2252640, partial [marine sediment metagenome]